MYDQNAVYVIGDARSSENNPITKHYKVFFIAFVIDRTSDKIIDVECSATIEITKMFVGSLFKGHSIWDTEQIASEINNRYLGNSQKALVVAFKDAQKRYKRLNQRNDSISS